MSEARGALAEKVLAWRPGAPPLLPRGAGSHPTGTTPGDCETVDLTGLDRVIEHAAEDLTVTLEAGVRVDALRARLADAGQWIPGLVGGPGTVGGALAADRRGVLAGRWGGLRDAVLGLTLLPGSGREIRAGGRVVKNVAGYDLGRLVAGSLGTFGAVVELTLRVEPRPPAALHTWTPGEPADPPAVIAALAAWTPDALTRERHAGVAGWATRFAGPRTRAEAFAARVEELLGPGTRVTPGGIDGEEAGNGIPVFGGALPAFLATWDPGETPGGADLRLDLLRGHVHGSVPATTRAEDLVRLRESLAAGEGHLHLRVPPDHALAPLAWGRTPGAEADLWRAVKTALDPRGVWAAGRLPGGV